MLAGRQGAGRLAVLVAQSWIDFFQVAAVASDSFFRSANRSVGSPVMLPTELGRKDSATGILYIKRQAVQD